MDRSGFLYKTFLGCFSYETTPCQDKLLRQISAFVTSDEGDILVVNGYAGTGKTSALASVVAGLSSLKVPCVLLAPTGRSAKVLSGYCGKPASTIHKHIYRQKSFGADGMGQFSLAPNKARGTLFIVDEVSLIGIATTDGGGAFGTGNLLADLISFVRSGVDCRLILVGDAAQLPPVGLEASPALDPGYMSAFGGVSFATLTTVVRQASDSGILVNATHLRVMLDSMEDPIELSDLGLSDALPDVKRIGGGELLETLSEAYDKYGTDEVAVLCRSNKRAVRYNAGIRAQVLYREEKLCRGDRLMVVKNNYRDDLEGTDYIANGDIAVVRKVRRQRQLYGFDFADVWLTLPDYDDYEVQATIITDALMSDAPALTHEQSEQLYYSVIEDYADIPTREERIKKLREDIHYNALQVKFAYAVTCHKAQGGQWAHVYVDQGYMTDDMLTPDYIHWLYTAFTRATEKLYLVNWPKTQTI